MGVIGSWDVHLIQDMQDLFTPFYISNADFYIVQNHIKIIYNSF
jgi:hypothetical protein